jgi:hypothetical protein
VTDSSYGERCVSFDDFIGACGLVTDAPYGERCVSFDDFIGACRLVTDAPYGERCVSFDDFIDACGLVTDAPYILTVDYLPNFLPQRSILRNPRIRERQDKVASSKNLSLR